MRRRAKGTGSLFQRSDGRWVGSIEVKDPITASGSAAASPARTHVRKVISKALQHALALGVVDRNVARLTKTSKVVHDHNEPWNAADARRFLEATRKADRWPLYALALSTGARQGELLALRWEDVDLDGGRLRIQRGALRQIGPREWEEQETKTRSSRRTLTLEPLARTALGATQKPSEHRVRVLSQRRSAAA